MTTLIVNAGSTLSWMRAAWLAHLEHAILRAEGTVGPGSAAPQSSGNRTLMIVLAVVGVLVVLCLCVFIGIPVILTLMGPSIGNVFSGINDNLQNP